MVDATLISTQDAPNTTGAPSPCSFSAKILLLGLRLLGALPFSARSAFGGALGAIIGRLPLRDAKIARLQLAAFLPEVSSAAIVPKVFAHIGRSLFESLNLEPLVRPPFTHITCNTWEVIAGSPQDTRPSIIITAHTGNWDLLAAYIIARGVPLSTVGREARNPTLQVALRALRDAYGIETIWRSEKGSAKRLMRCLKERRTIAALIDQDTRVDSCFAPFFGTPAKTPSALIELGKRFNARFVTIFIVRTKGTHFEVHAAELDPSPSTEEVLTEYHRRLEGIIRAHPEQWVWFHKRWRTIPQGETLSSTEYSKMLEQKISASRR